VDSSGVTSEARIRIESLFELVEKGRSEPAELKADWTAGTFFENIKTRFFSIFKKKH
jgi:hypothetical protein